MSDWASTRGRRLLQKWGLGRSFDRNFRHPARFLKVNRSLLKVIPTYRCNASCEFCFARGLAQEFGEDMTLEAFSSLIPWMRREGKEGVRFLGGEPTIHPLFPDFIDLCERQGIIVHVLTNNLFPPALRLLFRSPAMKVVVVNFEAWQVGSLRQRRVFEENLAFLLRAGPIVQANVIVDPRDNAWRRVVELCVALGVNHLRLTVAIPGFAAEVTSEDFLATMGPIGARLIEMVELCQQTSLPSIIYRPIPTCLLTAEQWAYLEQLGPYLGYTRCMLGYNNDYSSNVTVNPDLSVYPCTSIFTKGPSLLSFASSRELSEYYRVRLRPHLESILDGRCESCPHHREMVAAAMPEAGLPVERYFDRRLCQGGCLSFRVLEEGAGPSPMSVPCS